MINFVFLKPKYSARFMKNFILFLLLIISIVSFSQKITRGPDIGEIYFLGPTYSGKGLYYSDDFGETATFVDGNMNYISIAAEKTKGGIYCVKLPTALYYSDNFGYLNTWEFKFYNDYLSDKIVSGVIEGHIFSDCWMHSENYGSNFIVHSLNGWFGSLINVAIDITNENIGYALVYKMTQADSLYLLQTVDTFENVGLIKQWNYHWDDNIKLSGGSLSGELFLLNFTQNNLFLSQDCGEDFIGIDTFNFSDHYYLDMVGGRQTGEIYILYSFVNMLWQNAHVYVYHSLDYGKTFEVFHPFAKGNEPVLANFSADTTEGEMPFTVEFCNFSIGDIQQYEWDFDNDGIIDSYDEAPTWIYQDTGYYSVKLTITGTDSTNSFLKENYIHVQKATGFEEYTGPGINCYPNPFSNGIHFDFLHYQKHGLITIYDITGQQITTLNKPIGINKIVWDGKGKNGYKIKPGVYYAKFDNNTFFQKLILTE
jgi:PKD repeat protein